MISAQTGIFSTVRLDLANTQFTKLYNAMLCPGHLRVNFLRTAASRTFSSIRANLDMRPVSR